MWETTRIPIICGGGVSGVLIPHRKRQVQASIDPGVLDKGGADYKFLLAVVSWVHGNVFSQWKCTSALASALEPLWRSVRAQAPMFWSEGHATPEPRGR